MRQHFSKCLGGRAILAMCWLLTAVLLLAVASPNPANATEPGSVSQHIIGMPDGIADDANDIPVPEQPAAVVTLIVQYGLLSTSIDRSYGRDEKSISFLYSRPGQARAPPAC